MHSQELIMYIFKIKYGEYIANLLKRVFVVVYKT